MYKFTDIFVSFSIVALTAIRFMAKTVASGLFNCQESTLRYVYCYAVLNRLNNLLYKLSLISLLNVLCRLLLSAQVSNKYSMAGHTAQGGAVCQ